MKLSPRTLLIACALGSAAVLAYALYLQHVEGLEPCPLCVLQRYAFLAAGIGCAVAAASNKPLFAVIYSLLASLVGGGIATYHLWIKAHPKVSCGIDPLETSLNTIWPAQWLPGVFKADGLCGTPHAPILGLSIPEWSLVCFVSLALILTFTLFVLLSSTLKKTLQ